VTLSGAPRSTVWTSQEERLRPVQSGKLPRLSDRSCYTWAMTIASLQEQLRDFAAERDWEQFHTPKNLVMALAAEVGELTDLFQWLTPAESADVMSEPTQASRVREELADVFAYLLRITDVLGVDLEAALTEKMVHNAKKYPVEDSRGTAAKYTDLPAAGSADA
jgi:NTP pyrophosphatase (non-canonical NTP hydrolase)